MAGVIATRLVLVPMIFASAAGHVADKPGREHGGRDTFECRADYGEGRGDWRKLWSEKEKEWCCKNRKLGCDANVEDEHFKCDEGHPGGWSEAKIAHCCAVEGKGCALHTVALPDGVGGHAKTVDYVAAVAIAAQAQAGACGVSSVLAKSGSYVAPTSTQPVCNTRMTTNCSVSYAPMQCPPGCAFLVPDHHFMCIFECVPAGGCSRANANRPFPDPTTGMCLHCEVEACALCENEGKCSQCHPGFALSEDGTQCTFNVDMNMHPQLILQVLGYIVVGIVLLGVFWRLFKGGHAESEVNAVAIARGRLHRHLCKVQNWMLFNNRKVKEWYPLTVEVHNEHIVGVGLPLFYNSICFMAVVSLLCFGCTFMVFRRSPLAHSLSSPSDWSQTAMAAMTVKVASQFPAVIVSPLAHCGDTSASGIIDDVEAFAKSNFLALGFLYVSIFAVSFAHAVRQQRAADRYDARNKTMSDFALRVTGFDTNMTDEAEITKRVQEAFRLACPRPDTRAPVDVVGVSVCYNYRHVWGDVDAMKDRFMERMELDMVKRVGALDGEGTQMPQDACISAKHTSARSEETLRKQVEEDRARAKEWFEETSVNRLKSTGDVFIVFKRTDDRDAVFAAKEEAARRLASLAGIGQEVQLFLVFSEPPSINWWHLSKSKDEVKRNVQWAMFKILALIVLVQLCIVYPYAHYIVWPYSTTGSVAGGAKMQIAGVILGNINMFVGLQIFFMSYDLGFHRKDGVDMLVLCANTALVMINTFFNIFTNALMVFSLNNGGFGVEIFLTVDSLTAIGTEGRLASSIYAMMMPGSFFVGFLMCIVMAGVVPFVWNTFLMKVIYIWRCLPDGLLNVLRAILPWAADLSLEHYPYRRAERGFEPMEISLAGDYTTMIVNPSVCFCMLFFVSPYVWRTFQMLLVSTVFQYFFYRYQHLRFCKACYYTTNRLDTVVNFLWGIPLSIIAAAWCVWGFRSEAFGVDWSTSAKLLCVSLAFFTSLVMWVMNYQYWLRPFELRDAVEEGLSTFEEVRADTLYSWFNCNPVYVLKCEYYFQDIKKSDSIVRTPGALSVTIKKARGLRAETWTPTIHTPAVRVSCELVGKSSCRVESTASKDGKNPEWNFTGEVPHYHEGDELLITLTDGGKHSLDSLAGKAVLTGRQVKDGFSGEVELDMGARHGKAYLDIVVEPPLVPAQMTRITITSAKGLHDVDWVPGTGKSDPYVVCSVEGKPEIRLVTPVHSNMVNPEWHFSSGLNLDKADSLVFAVMDHNNLFHDGCLGKAVLKSAQVSAGFAGEMPLEDAGKNAHASVKVKVDPPKDGARLLSTSSRGHPLACGEDPKQVRFFEVGKEYLFLAPEKQALVWRDTRCHSELETLLEHVLGMFGAFVSLCVRKAEEEVREGFARLEGSEKAEPFLRTEHSGDILLGSKMNVGGLPDKVRAGGESP